MMASAAKQRRKSKEIVLTQEKTVHCVKMPNDDNEVCDIRSILCLSDGHILVADSHNSKVKLLDEKFKLVSYCCLPLYIFDLCQVDPLKVAVVHTNFANVLFGQETAVQFIRLNNRKLEVATNLKLLHTCLGIAHHRDSLYVTSGTALYQYTMTGTPMKKLYEDTSLAYTVHKCAVGITGDKLFVSDCSHHKLLTLAMDGTVMSEFSDPALQHPHTVHVTTRGQVIVCGHTSNTVIQVDSQGSKKIATLLTQVDGVVQPSAVWYRENSIIVGLLENNNILVFTIK